MTTDLHELVERLDVLAAEVDTFEPPVQATVVELIELMELIHRSAVTELSERLGRRVEELRAAHPAIAWLFEAYDTSGSAVEDRDSGPASLPIYPG